MNHTPATFDLFKSLGEAFDPKNAKAQLRAIEKELKDGEDSE